MTTPEQVAEFRRQLKSDELNCRSVNTKVVSDHLPQQHCRLEEGHQGQCHDGAGHRWTRLDELLRQDGLELFGYLVRKI